MTRDQLALIHIAKKQLRVDDALYREILRDRGGVESARDLDAAGFQRVMAVLEKMGFKTSSARKPMEIRPGFASDAQLDMILSLWRAYAGEGNDAALNKWLEKWFKVSNVRFLRSSNASKVIEALKKMSVRPPPKADRDAGPTAA